MRRGHDQQLRADILAILYGKFSIIVNNLLNDPKYSNLPNVQRLIQNWQSGISIKEIGNMESDAAYVINKRNMSFCLQKSTNSIALEELNLITYVGIHELAHIMTISVGHTEEFWNNFRILLRVAVELKLYKNQDYSNKPVDYCGTKITDTPLKD